MRRSYHLSLGLSALAACLLVLKAAKPSCADTFGSGEFTFEIPFVTVGDPGNPADTTGAPNPAGSVPYTYRIGQFEVPEVAVRNANALSELAGEPLGITLDERGPNQPATSLSWFEAARFVNFLNEDQGFSPAYKFNDAGEFELWQPGDAGFNPNNLFRNSLARYVLPSVDEWYKAAFYDPETGQYFDFPTGSDEPPTPVPFGTDPGTAVFNQTTGPADVMLAGGASPFGTVGQGGNVFEWHEGPTNGSLDEISTLDLRAFRGGTSGLSSSAFGLSNLSIGDRVASFPGATIGFRVATVPEPPAALITFFLVQMLPCMRARKLCAFK